MQDIGYSRSLIEGNNATKVPLIYDFAYGDFLASQTFFDELSRIQTAMVLAGKVTLGTGLEVSMDDTGGLMALQMYMETLNTKKEAASGLSKSGLKYENKWWTLQ